MKSIIIFDTNFLVNNTGNIKEIVNELQEKNFDVYVPELVKEEFINIQLRKLEETYDKIENYKSLKKIMDLKYREKEEAEKIVEETYNGIFEQNFKDKIITYDKKEMLSRVLSRNRYKKPPFYNESNSSDKGFKDTIILLTIIVFMDSYEEEIEFYLITSDNGFIKYKNDIEKEVIEKCHKNIVIIEGKDKNKLYKELKIVEEEVQEETEENPFFSQEINIEEIRKKINELMGNFISIESIDYYGNEQIGRRFEISNYITNEKTEKFLNNIDGIIEDNIFRNEIMVELFFDAEEWVFSHNSIDVDVMKEISELYKIIKETKYKAAFINYISQKINENKVSNIFSEESDGYLPF